MMLLIVSLAHGKTLYVDNHFEMSGENASSFLRPSDDHHTSDFSNVKWVEIVSHANSVLIHVVNRIFVLKKAFGRMNVWRSNELEQQLDHHVSSEDSARFLSSI